MEPSLTRRWPQGPVRGWLAAVLLLAGLALWWPHPPTAAVTTAAPDPQQTTTALPMRGAGELVARSEVQLTSRSNLRVAAVLVEVGDRVVEGQTLLQLESSELEAGLVAASAALTNMRELQTSAERTLERARLRQQQTRTDDQRLRQLSLLEPGSVAEAELADRQVERQAAQLDVDIGASQWRAAEAARQQAHANWQAANARLQDATLRAPFDALVIARHCSVGDVVAPGQPGLTLVAPDSLRVQARFDESLLSRIRPGDHARVWLKSQPRVPVEARVVRLNRMVDTDTREFSVDLQLGTLPANWALGERAIVEMQPSTDALSEPCMEQPCADVLNGLREWQR